MVRLPDAGRGFKSRQKQQENVIVILQGKLSNDDELMLNVLRCQLTYLGQVVTNAEARFSNSLCPQKPEGLLGRTAQDVYLDSHTAPEL